METESEGGVKRRIVLRSKVLFKKVREVGEGTQKGVRRKVRVRVKTFSPSPFGLPPSQSGYEEGTVSITKVK